MKLRKGHVVVVVVIRRLYHYYCTGTLSSTVGKMPKKSSRQVVQMETAEDAVVDSTMCGCEIDPLSGRSHYFQLMFMVGLPLIPVTTLVIYSLLKLSSTVKQFTELQVFSPHYLFTYLVKSYRSLIALILPVKFILFVISLHNTQYV